MPSRIPLNFVKILARLPWSLRSQLGRLLGRAFGLIPTRDRLIARLQCELCFGREVASKIVAASYASLGQTLFESLNLEPMLQNLEEHLDAPWESMRELFGHGRPVIALSAHTGNWDLLAAAVAKAGFEVSAVGRPARNASFQLALEHLRSVHKIKTLWRLNSGSTKELLKCLKRGEIVASLIDQDTRVESLLVPFFGIPAATPRALYDIAKRQDAIIATAFLMRIGPERFKLHLDFIDPALSAEVALTQFNARLEQVIHQYPDQWVWLHKRWRTLEDGSRLSSREYVRHLRNLLKKK